MGTIADHNLLVNSNFVFFCNICKGLPDFSHCKAGISLKCLLAKKHKVLCYKILRNFFGPTFAIIILSNCMKQIQKSFIFFLTNPNLSNYDAITIALQIQIETNYEDGYEDKHICLFFES